MKSSELSRLFARAYRITASARPDGPLKEAELKTAEWFENQSVVYQAGEVLEEIENGF